MSARRQRMTRVAKVAAETEEKARALWLEADRRVQQVDEQREAALDRAAQLANLDLSLAFRSHLTGAGARHLTSLADRKLELASEAESLRADLQQAVTKVRSLERLIERIDRETRERARRAEAAELQDLVAVRAAHARAIEQRHGTAAGGIDADSATAGVRA